MRISNFGDISLGSIQFGDATYCSIVSANDGDPQLDQLAYEVTSSNGLQVSGSLSRLEYAQITPQGTAPYTATLNFPNREVSPLEVKDISSANFDLAVVYVGPSGYSNTGQVLNGPYAWVTQPQSASQG